MDAFIVAMFMVRRWLLPKNSFFDVLYTIFSSVLIKFVIVRKKIRKRRLFKEVQAFCEEKVLR